jgi:hypothetical protein
MRLRRVSLCLVLGLLAAAPPALAAQRIDAAVGALGTAETMLPEALIFAVTRDGTPFGSHRVSFAREGDRLIVETQIAFKVKIAFLTVFRYTMNAREEWLGAELQRFESKTDSDGKAYFVRAERTSEGLRVESSSGSYIAPPGVMPFTYWNRGLLDQTQVINPERGRLETLTVERRGEDRLMIGAKPVAVEKVRLSTNNDYDLLYEIETGRWVGGSFERRGFLIGYAPAQPVAAETAAAR